jgi:hypothetical protein
VALSLAALLAVLALGLTASRLVVVVFMVAFLGLQVAYTPADTWC